MKKLILILLVLASINSFACRCANGGLQLNKYAETADIAIKGKVLSIKTIDKSHYFKVKIEKQYKGSLTTEVVEIRTMATTSCRYELAIGKVYFVFASSNSDNTYSTGSCSGNLIFDAAREGELKQ